MIPHCLAVLQWHHSPRVKTHEHNICSTIGEPPVLVVVSECVPQSQTHVNTVDVDSGVVQDLKMMIHMMILMMILMRILMITLLTSLYILYWSMAQTVGTWVLRSWDSPTFWLQALAQMSLVLPTALSPTSTHFTSSVLGCSSSILRPSEIYFNCILQKFTIILQNCTFYKSQTTSVPAMILPTNFHFNSKLQVAFLRRAELLKIIPQFAMIASPCNNFDHA